MWSKIWILLSLLVGNVAYAEKGAAKDVKKSTKDAKKSKKDVKKSKKDAKKSTKYKFTTPTSKNHFNFSANIIKRRTRVWTLVQIRVRRRMFLIFP